MSPAVIVVLVLVAIVVLAVGFVMLQRRRRVGRVIAADTSRLQRTQQ